MENSTQPYILCEFQKPVIERVGVVRHCYVERPEKAGKEVILWDPAIHQSSLDVEE